MSTGTQSISVNVHSARQSLRGDGGGGALLGCPLGLLQTPMLDSVASACTMGQVSVSIQLWLAVVV